MRKTRRCTTLVTALLLMGLPGIAFAQSKLGEICTSEFPTPPPKVETGLDVGVDDLAYSVYALHWRVKQVDREGWEIAYGDASFADKTRQLINVLRGQSVPYTTSHLAHELGHATGGFGENTSSREAYIKSRCTDEGYALGVNINARKSIKQCAGADIGVVSTQVPFFTEWYESMAAAPPISYGDFGFAFCERNVESISGKNYLDYYGDWYDSHIAANPPTPQHKEDAIFFEKVSVLADLAGQGVDTVRTVWPAGDHLTFSVGPRPRSYHGERALLVGTIHVVKSELRVKRSDPSQLVLATMDIAGPCIGLEAVRTEYPSAIMTSSPSTGLPYDEGAWSAFGPWGEIAFGFAYANPKCISSITFKPDAFPPSMVGEDI